jgi:hypothetical protein
MWRWLAAVLVARPAEMAVGLVDMLQDTSRSRQTQAICTLSALAALLAATAQVQHSP